MDWEFLLKGHSGRAMTAVWLGACFSRIVSQRGVWVFQKLEHGRSQSRHYGLVCAYYLCLCL
jgi:hypothetical protein